MNIFKAIKNWFTKVGNTIHKFVLEISDFALEHCQNAVSFLQAIKNGINTDTFKTLEELVTTLIPGTLDNVTIEAIVAILNENIPKACTALNIVYNAATAGTDIEKLAAALNGISNATTDQKAKIYTELAAMITLQLSDGKISWSEAIVDTQYIYQNKETFGIK